MSGVGACSATRMMGESLWERMTLSRWRWAAIERLRSLI